MIDQLTFEQLVEAASSHPVEAYHEFVRRLQPIVFEAASHSRNTASQVELDDLADRAFSEFAPEFASGGSDTVLLRFASAIRRVLGVDALDDIGVRFHAQLIVYHLVNDEERRILAAAYGDGLRDPAVLATRFNMPPDRVRTLLRSANRALKSVATSEFGPGELERLTEGHLPRGIM